MQQFNFNPLDFSRIPQQETQARQNWYNSWSNMASNIGKDISDTAKDVGTAIDTQNQRDLAEEWKKKQWTNQMYNQYLQNRRYKTQQEQLAEEKLRNQTAADALRKQFLANHTYDSLEKYGPGAQFALSQIENAPDYQGVVAGGNTLSNIINQRDMIDAQRAEEAEERFVPSFLKDYDTRLAYENQVDFNKPEQTALGYSMAELGTKYSNLMGEKEDLEALILSNPAYKSPEVVKRLNNLDAMTKILKRRIMEIRHPGETVF